MPNFAEAPRLVTGVIWRNKFISIFVTAHILFAVFLGRLFAFAPDEGGYLYAFNNIYGSRDPNPQLSSGWITAPKPFLWVSYLPAKLLSILGVPDYLAIRLLSIALMTASMILLMNLYLRTQSIANRKYGIFCFFYIPSVFLWSSVGLRETFILLTITLVLVGIVYLFDGEQRRAAFFLISGSYGLLSTKSYLWICMVAAALGLITVEVIRRKYRRKLPHLIVALILVPSLLFATTTSWYALKFIVASVFHTDVTSVGQRSGDSIIQVAIPNKKLDTGGSTLDTGGSTLDTGGSTLDTGGPTLDTGEPTPGGLGGPSGFTAPTSGGLGGPSGFTAPTSGVATGSSSVVTFHGDTTLIALHFYLLDNPKAPFARVLTALGATSKIQSVWDEKVKDGLVKKTTETLPESSSLSGYILKPGSIHDPLSIFRPAFLFLFGPIPFLDQDGLALTIVSFESPFWWLLYIFVGYQILSSRKSMFLQDPAIVFTLILTGFFVAFSALVEVNLGTSFRHRSIIFVPLIFLFVRLRSKFNPRPV